MRQFKSFIFENYWWITPLLGLAIGILWLKGVLGDGHNLFLSLIGGLLSFAFFVQKQKLDELKLFRELFKDFNDRYQLLNDDLERLANNGRIDAPNDRQIVVKYFNLCAEEYFWSISGLIPNNVWTAWCRGMEYYLSREPFAQRWESEVKTGSYYGLTIAKIKAGARA